ncbi:MAG: DUF6776 family protein [Acidiferrobacteraceae bacterium]
MIQNFKGDVVVRPRSSMGLRMFMRGVFLLLLVLGGTALYRHGLAMAGFDRAAAVARQHRLEAKVARLSTENHTLRQGLVVAERSLQMDQTAYRDLNGALDRSARRITRLEERVDLYRTVLSSPTPVQGVTIERLTLRRASGQRYRYALILVQPFEARGAVFGRVRFKIKGSSSGVPVTFTFPGTVDKAIPVHFKYFQDIEGSLELPAGFAPELIDVDVQAQGRKIQKRFSWPTSG